MSTYRPEVHDELRVKLGSWALGVMQVSPGADVQPVEEGLAAGAGGPDVVVEVEAVAVAVARVNLIIEFRKKKKQRQMRNIFFIQSKKKSYCKKQEQK